MISPWSATTITSVRSRRPSASRRGRGGGVAAATEAVSAADCAIGEGTAGAPGRPCSEKRPERLEGEDLLHRAVGRVALVATVEHAAERRRRQVWGVRVPVVGEEEEGPAGRGALVERGQRRRVDGLGLAPGPGRILVPLVW